MSVYIKKKPITYPSTANPSLVSIRSSRSPASTTSMVATIEESDHVITVSSFVPRNIVPVLEPSPEPDMLKLPPGRGAEIN